MFDFFKRKPEKFVSNSAFEANLASQLAMTPQTLAQLREYGVTDQSSLKLEFFFYTNTLVKAESLAHKLAELGYAVEYGQSAEDNNTYLITGWTVPVLMSDKSMLDWTEQMCRLGYAQDCEFDGWGTNPEQ